MGVVTKSIGTSGRNYSTLQAWEDALPANLSTDGNSQVGECYNDSEFTSSLTISGETTDATNNITLKCASGQSFYDNANKVTNALQYNQANGVGVNVNDLVVGIISIVSLNVTIDGLQLKNGLQFGVTGASSTHVIKNCIIQAVTTTTGSDGVIRGTPIVAINCLAISSGGGVVCISLGNNSEFYNCTAICQPNGGGAKGFRGNYDAPIAKNCASFHSGQAFGSSFSASSDYNAGDDTSVPGAHSLLSLTFASQFVDTVGGDYRAIVTGSLDGSGTRDATKTADLDIIKQNRSTTTPTIGAWEVVAAAAASGQGDSYIMITS